LEREKANDLTKERERGLVKLRENLVVEEKGERRMKMVWRERERDLLLCCLSRERESLGVIKEKCEDPQVLGFFYKNVIVFIFSENENSKNVYSFSIFKLIFLDAKMKSEYKRQGQTSILVVDPKKLKMKTKYTTFFS